MYSHPRCLVTVQLNGQPREILASRTIEELLDELQLSKPTILIEHNGVALRRGEWPNVILSEGDRIEAIRIVAGG